ncbi:putative diguanylate cyclase YdaM [Fundidesulfovibrio magnetotacticus]|uniref:histidine kinase n=1 Tax=Fundidesulfovibrio magnetotacticus TaxID=2730080 RepID=A0A6V8LYP4_9BACT|nr:putative diguanylate cyclase YdaM [Fundidesulfovibrio magnetotacticus]
MKKRFGNRLRNLRQQAGLTQVQLAERVGLSDRYLGRVERGMVSPSFECIERMAQALGVDPAELFLTAGQMLAHAPVMGSTLDDVLQERAAILRALPGLTVKFVDTDLRILWVHTSDPESPMARGLDCTGQRCHEAFHDRQEACPGCLVPQAMARLEPVEGEVASPAGRSFLIRCTPVMGGDGTLRGALHLSLDITARKAVEEALSATRRRLEHMLSSLPVVLYALDAGADFAQTSVSDNVQEVLGHHPSDFLETPGFWRSLVHPADSQRLRQAIPNRLIEQNFLTLEYRVRHGAGGWRWVRDSLRLQRGEDGKPREVFGAVLDITDSKASEIALRESEARYRTLFLDNCTVQLVTDVTTGVILDANPAAEAFYGYPLSELRGMHIASINMLGPVKVMDVLREASASRQNLLRFRHRLSGGELRDVEARVTALEISGRPVIHSLIIDVTGLRTSEPVGGPGGD